MVVMGFMMGRKRGIKERFFFGRGGRAATGARFLFWSWIEFTFEQLDGDERFRGRRSGSPLMRHVEISAAVPVWGFSAICVAVGEVLS